ncbi:MAG: LamG domain-containing protein [Gemmatales bacterium]
MFTMKWPIGWKACLAALMLVPVHVFAQDYRTTVLNTPNLLGYWPFTTASGANSVVGGYTGTFNGASGLGAPGSGPILASDPGNRPVNLNGNIGNFVNTNMQGGITTGGSIVGWFNLAQLPSAAGRVFAIAGIGEAGNDFDLQIETDNEIKFYTANSGGFFVALPTAMTATDLGVWHFIAATFTANGTSNLYLDGNPVVSAAAGGHSPGNNFFGIGENFVFPFRQFNGSLDEIAVFSRELTAGEVGNIYASRLVAAVPEPASILMLGSVVVVVGVGVFRYRRKQGLVKGW